MSLDLDRILKDLGIKLTQLSKMSDVPISRLSDIAAGKTQNPQMKTLKKIADALNMSVDGLVKSENGNILPVISEQTPPIYSVTKIIEGIRPDQYELLVEWERLTEEERKLTLGVMRSMKGGGDGKQLTP